MRVHNAPVRVREARCEWETTTIKSREESYYRVTCVTCVRTCDVCACVRVLGVFSMYILYVYSLEEFFFFLFL